MKIKIADLDLSLQTRAGTDAETINNYAEAMADGAQFPDVTVFTDGKRYWLADGFHRVMAAKQNGSVVKMKSEGYREDTVDLSVSDKNSVRRGSSGAMPERAQQIIEQAQREPQQQRLSERRRAAVSGQSHPKSLLQRERPSVGSS